MRTRVTFPFELSIRRGLQTESIMQRLGGGVAAPGTARAHPLRGCHSARTSEGPVSPADVSPVGVGPAFHPPWPAPNTQELGARTGDPAPPPVLRSQRPALATASETKRLRALATSTTAPPHAAAAAPTLRSGPKRCFLLAKAGTEARACPPRRDQQAHSPPPPIKTAPSDSEGPITQDPAAPREPSPRASLPGPQTLLRGGQLSK